MKETNFSEALTAVKAGKLITRSVWAKDCYLYHVAGSTFKVNREPLISILGEG